MLVVISPAKSLDLTPQKRSRRFTQPEFLDEAEVLIRGLRKLSKPAIARLMGVSDTIADENRQRFAQWKPPFAPDNAKQSLFMFRGDVYTAMAPEDFAAADLTFAQKHLRSLSGLYGVLRPLDLIQPYRLEMGTRFKTRRGETLYDFWGDRIQKYVEAALAKGKDRTLINLASNEYFNVLRPKELQPRVVTPVFKEEKNGRLKVISFVAKRARGLMCRYIIQNKLSTPEDLRSFNLAGYRFSKQLSKDDQLVFTRKSPTG